MHDDAWKPAVNESEVVVPDVFRALALGVDPEIWADAQTLAPMLEGADLGRALRIVRNAGGLGLLLRQDTPGLEGLGLSETESSRFRSFPALASRILSTRKAAADLSTRRDVANEISFRGLQFDMVTVGVIAWDQKGRRVADRILAIGTTLGANFNLSHALRVAVCAGGVSMVLWVWQPATMIEVNSHDRQIADELRLMASALHVVIEDVLLIGQGDADPVSLAVLDQWQQ